MDRVGREMGDGMVSDEVVDGGGGGGGKNVCERVGLGGGGTGRGERGGI